MSIIKPHEITLQENGIILRPLADEHLPLLYKWNADPEVLYWCEGDDVQENDPETVNDIYSGVSQNAFCFLIETDGIPVGECWLQEMNVKDIAAKHPGKDVRRIDMMIGEKSHWNRGIGTTLIKMLTNFAFNNQQTDIIYAIVSDYNPRSRRVFEKNGFKIFWRGATDSASVKAKEDFHLVLMRDS